MVKDEDGGWSPPSAIGLAGVGWGFLMGGAIKDVMIFLMDKDTVDTYSGTAQAKLGAQGNVTIGPIGRDAEVAVTASNQGVGGTVSVAFSKGGFIGFSLQGAILGPRDAVNATFYGKELSPRQILFSDEFTVPDETHIPDIHRKLNQLSEGLTALPTEEEKEKSEKLLAEAEEKAKSVPKEDIEFVDAAKKAEEEAEKQSQSRIFRIQQSSSLNVDLFMI